MVTEGDTGPNGTAAAGDAASRLAELIRESASTVALTGAGISVPSGVPDFRSPQSGLWEQFDPFEVAHIDAFRRDPKRFWDFYRPRFGMLADKQPNDAHLALAELERRGLLEGVVTQNIDRLHATAGTRRLLEIHGSIETSSCSSCRRSYALADVEGLFDEEGVAICTECAAPVRPDVVLFGEMLPERAITEAQELAAGADLILCVGSSLEVHPAAGLADLTLASGGRVAIITQGRTPYDEYASVRLDRDVADDLRSVMQELGEV